MLIRFLILYVTAHRAWPGYPPDRLAAACRHAIVVGDALAIPPPVLLAIAQHESDLEPGTVSYRDENGARVDLVGADVARISAAPARVFRMVGGYLSAMCFPVEDCIAMIDGDGGMLRGALEIAEWSRTCHGDPRCTLAGHAGGNAGMLADREHRDTQATRFADLFLSRARVLGWR